LYDDVIRARKKDEKEGHKIRTHGKKCTSINPNVIRSSEFIWLLIFYYLWQINVNRKTLQLSYTNLSLFFFKQELQKNVFLSILTANLIIIIFLVFSDLSDHINVNQTERVCFLIEMALLTFLSFFDKQCTFNQCSL